MIEELKKKKYFQIGLVAFIVIFAAILSGFIIFNIGGILKDIKFILKVLSPFIIGFVIAYLLNPIVKFFKNNLVDKMVKKNNKLSNNLSILITCIVVTAILILLFSIIIPDLLRSVEKLAINLPKYFEDIKNYLLQRLTSTELKTMIINNYEEINAYFNTIINTSLLPKVEEWLLVLSNGLIGVLKIIYNITIGFVIAIYYLADKDNFIAGTKRLIYTIFPIKTANKILEDFRHTDNIFGNFIVGKLLDSLIIGLITFAFLAIFRFPYALLVGVIVGVTNIIPYFGPWMGSIPSALLILMEDPRKCIIFIVFILALQQIDGNVIGPKLCGSKTGLKSFWVLASILVFGELFGVIGMLVGVPIFAIIYGNLSNRIAIHLKEKELPISNAEYLNLERINSQTKRVVEQDNIGK